LHRHLGRMARSAAAPRHAARGVAGDSARPAPAQAAAAEAQVQRRAADRLHQRHRDGCRLAADGAGDLQAGAVRMAGEPARRLPGSALRALLAGHRLRALLHGPYRPGDPGRMEQLPRHAHRLRSGARGGGGRMRKHPARKAPPAGPKPAPVPRACPAAVSDDAEREIGRLSRRSLLRGVVPVGAALLGWRWLITRREDNGLPWPFRRALEINEQLARDYYRTARLSPAFPRSLAAEPRPNGDEGMSDDFDPERWMLRVEGLATSDGQSETPITLSLDAIKALPRTDVVTELRCIEGWSQVVHLAGARFLDFARK